MYTIEVKGLHKGYKSGRNHHPILKGIDLRFKKGELTGIIGRSGQGKSTLLRCLNLLEKPDSGKVIFNGVDLTSTAPTELRKARSRIGVIFQALNLLSLRNVRRNISLPLELVHLSSSLIESRVQEIAKRVGIHEKLERYPDELSGGQRQRVAIARALVSELDVLLCDEITSALDTETSEDILELLQGLAKEYGLTVVLVSHDLALIQKYCQSIYSLENGQTVQKSPRVYPANFAASERAPCLVLL